MQQNDLFSIWHPYTEWECYQSGMWESRGPKRKNIEAASAVLGVADVCEKAMRNAIKQYPKAAEHHLTKLGNRRPWIGQAACVAYGATEEETRLAWCNLLTDEQREIANAIADVVIADWERGDA